LNGGMPRISRVTSEKSLGCLRSSAAMPSIAISAFRQGGVRGRRILAQHPPPGVDLARFRKLHGKNPDAPHAMPHRPLVESKMVYPRPAITQIAPTGP